MCIESEFCDVKSNKAICRDFTDRIHSTLSGLLSANTCIAVLGNAKVSIFVLIIFL